MSKTSIRSMSNLSMVLALSFLGAGSSYAQPLSWVRGPSIPGNATIGGGENGGPLYVCRGAYGGGVHPGKIVSGNCNIGWGGKEILLSSYEILTGAGGWGPAQAQFAGAYAAGGENGQPLYLCHGRYNGGVHPGKVINGNCNIGWGGAEVALAGYEVFYPAVRSLSSNAAVRVTIRNGTAFDADFLWADYHGQLVRYGKLAPGQQIDQATYATHPWVLQQQGRTVATYVSTAAPVQYFGLGCSAATRAIEAGPIWNQQDAEQKCPAVCLSHSGTWTKQWSTTQWGRMSVCECSGFLQ